MQKRQIGVIGGGISGLICAAYLQQRGHHVRLFERARWPGGSKPRYRDSPAPRAIDARVGS